MSAVSSRGCDGTVGAAQVKMLRMLVWVAVAGCAQPTTAIGSLVATAVEPPGGNCVKGGLAIETGRDLDGNGRLDPDEIDATSYVCQPTPPPPQLAIVIDVPPGA